MSIYLNTYKNTLNSKYETESDRICAIKTISDLRNGNSFEHYKNKWYMSDADLTITDEQMKKLYVTFNFMDKCIKKFVSYCPNLDLKEIEGSKSKQDKKRQLLKKLMTNIGWETLNDQIYDILESKGDCFFYKYYESKESTIPNLKLLNSENITKILLDEFDKPQAYIYKEWKTKEILNYQTGDIFNTKQYEKIWIFEKGKITIIEPLFDTTTGEIIVDDKGNTKLEKSTVMNSIEDTQDFAIIHIPSFKKNGEKFSIIPADDYIDKCLHLDQITSDLRATNRQLGFPKWVIIDGKFTKGGNGTIGSILYAETKPAEDNSSYSDRQAKILDFQINNNLKSIFDEFQTVRDDLYDTVGITSPSLLKTVGSSDSSKVFQQLNSRMEQKIEMYINNIVEAFKPFFKNVLKRNGLYEEKYDVGYSFKKPVHIIKVSPYDKALYEQLIISNGTATIQSLLRERGYSEEQIDRYIKETQEELLSKNKEFSINKDKNVNNTEEEIDKVEKGGKV